jgi:protoporphyrinogen oxidase
MFPLLKLPEKIRAAFVIAFLKLSPFLSLYEKQTASEFLKKTMGDRVWKVLWEQLFRKKFGKYAENILTSFIWARIKKRTKALGYYEGGFQEFINILETQNINLGVNIKKNNSIENIKKSGGEFILNNTEKYDAIISTLPTPVLANKTINVLPNYYINKLKKIKYLWSVTQIIETDIPLFNKTYWINVSDAKIPIMGLVQHTNYMDKKNYSNNNILYIGNYVDEDDKRLKMENKELLNYYLPYLKKINSNYKILNTKYYLYKFPFSQPIFDKDFLKNKPDFITPVKNFFIANLDMTYPYDRGSNYAVLLGKKVSNFFI